MPNELDLYRSRGARALVLLHEQHLRRWLAVWKQARAANLRLLPSDNPAYRSLEHLLWHVLHAAGQYMRSMCQLLGLPDPDIEAVPEVQFIESEADAYLEHLLARWRLPLADVADDRMEPPEEDYHPGMPYWIDAMLEHAVMHPVRHEFQLRELLVRD